jgi:hypothetical protein
MQLPEALRPWREWLEWFAPQHLPLFADLLGRINPVLGPLRGRQQGGIPEPDGLGDLQRRGPYERLLSSEWLLADEVPDEFLRRAAVGEHMFLAPQYRAREANRLIVVLLDAGPLQLGAARLVHLALMMLLARRAREAGAEVRWGILQSAPQLHEFDSAAQLKRLLQARTWQTVTDDHWQAWRAWLAEQQPDAGECWMVGQRLPKTDSQLCTHRVQIHRSLDGRNLSFELQAATTRRVSLPIPDERLALQLLKGQFDGEVAVTAPAVKGDVARVVLTLPPVISSAGTHVAMKMLDEAGMVVIRLPAENQKKALEVRRHHWTSGQVPLAAAFMNGTLGAVMSAQFHLVFWNMPGLNMVEKPDRDEMQLPPGTATLLPAAWLRNKSAGRLFLLDSQGHLAFWVIAGAKTPASPKIRKTHRLAAGVLGLARVDREVVAYVRKDGNRLHAHSVDAEGNVSSGHVVGIADGVTQVLFAATTVWRGAFGGCALLTEENGCERWMVIGAGSSPVPMERIELVSGWKALGLLRLEREDHYSLLVISPNQQTIALHSAGQQRVLFTTVDAIARVSFCPMSGLVAALTGTRELLVYSVPQGTMRLQVFCNKMPEKTEEGANA